MAVVHILYKEDNKELIDYVFISIDGKPSEKIIKNKTKKIELEKGKHKLKITTNNLEDIKIKDTKNVSIKTQESIWVEQEISVEDDDLYYILHSPLLIKNQGKLENTTKEKFEKTFKTNKFWTSKIGVGILIIIALIILLIF